MDNFNDAQVEPEVFRGAATRYDQSIVVFVLDLVESGIEREIMPTLFGVRLVAFEIVDGRADDLAGFFAGTDSVDGMDNHQLERSTWANRTNDPARGKLLRVA